MRANVVRFAGDKSGATSIEYALIAAIVCLGLIASFTGVRDGVNGLFSNASNALGQ
jgi:pilus assembly protein Flp/PilA